MIRWVSTNDFNTINGRIDNGISSGQCRDVIDKALVTDQEIVKRQKIVSDNWVCDIRHWFFYVDFYLVLTVYYVNKNFIKLFF